jgi:2-desacetyl-2-hydroxyethyl bacteriochlorophyllide A dehydrogenase
MRPTVGQVLVRTAFSVISPGTERALYLGLENTWATYPVVAGYSQVGQVIAAGDDCALAPGQWVATTGPHANLYLAPGARAIPVPHGLPHESAALVGIGVIAQQGVRKAAIVPGDRVLVLGAGLVGQLAAQLAQAAGGEVTLTATSDTRLAAARACGIANTIAMGTQRERLVEVRANVVIDASGSPNALRDAAVAFGVDPRVVLLGSPREVSRALRLDRDLTLVGAHVLNMPVQDESPHSWTWSREARTFLAFATERLRLEPLFTATVTPAHVAAAYAGLSQPEDRSIAILIDWTAPGPWHALVEGSSALRTVARGAFRMLRRPQPVPAVFHVSRGDGRRLRFGLVGCGEIAVESAAALRAASNAAVTFAVDPDIALARGLAEPSGAGASVDLDALLRSREVDAVLISTPHHLHAPLAIRCLRAGKHVVVEKPMALCVAECDQMIDAAREAGRTLSVCYSYRFDPRVRRARELFKAGVIGDLVATHLAWCQERSAEYWRRGLTGRTTSDWRAHRHTAGGGVLMMNACHLLDMMSWVVGRPVVEVIASAATLAQPVDVEDTVTVAYRYQGGAMGSLMATTALVGPPKHEQWLQGTEGQLWVAPALRFWPQRETPLFSARRWHTPGHLARAADRRHFFEGFAHAVLEGGPPPVTAGEARQVQAVIEAAYSAAEGKRSVSLAPMEERPS